MRRVLFLVLFLGLLSDASAVRLKDIANIRGVRENQLIGYGLVVGLKGSGDNQLEFTNKSMKRMLEKLGVKLDEDDVVKKNVAAVLVTATLPAFARAGNRLDIKVSSIGDASSLAGGTLIQTPLKAADQNVYAVAQGSIAIGSSSKKAHTTVGHIPGGAFIEKDILQSDFTSRKMYRLTLHNPDITTSVRAAKTINLDLGGRYARAVDPGTIDVVVPFSYEGRGIELLATIESLPIEPDAKAKVIINEKTGTIVIGENVKITSVAISHNGLNIRVKPPKPAEGDAQMPERALASAGGAKKKKDKEPRPKVYLMKETTSVGELVQSLNETGISPKDLISILQNIKASGALQGELEIL